MAKFWNDLKRHEDNVEKHKITDEEIEFLLELQKEMNTQDHVSQADPRFWVIQGSEKEYGIETGFEDGADLVEDTEVVACDMESAAEYIKNELLEEINQFDGIQRSVELKKGIFHPSIVIKWTEDNFEDSVTLDNMKEVLEWLDEQGYEYRVANYRIVSKTYPNTFFLTQKAAEEHLRSNYYHYSDDAHTYAMTSWRNPETEKLWKIIQEVDWNRLIEKSDAKGEKS